MNACILCPRSVEVFAVGRTLVETVCHKSHAYLTHIRRPVERWGNKSEPALCLEQFFRLISGPLEGGAWSQANFEGNGGRCTDRTCVPPMYRMCSAAELSARAWYSGSPVAPPQPFRSNLRGPVTGKEREAARRTSADRPAARQPLWLAAQVVPRALGAAADRRRGELPYLDRGQPSAPGLLSGPTRGQACNASRSAGPESALSANPIGSDDRYAGKRMPKSTSRDL